MVWLQTGFWDEIDGLWVECDGAIHFWFRRSSRLQLLVLYRVF